jgi:hypothetical protein
MPLLLLSIILFSGSFAQGKESDGVQTHSLDGIWLSDGYALLIEVEGDHLHTYQVTALSCLPSWSATRRPRKLSDRETVYVANSRTIRFPDHEATGTERMRVDGTASDILLHRIGQRPKSCDQQAVNTPQNNYAIFWETFRENYPFFGLHHVDWSAVDQKSRPQVGSGTKPEELFAVLRKMIEPLRDSHTGIEAPDLKVFFDGWRSDPNHLQDEDWKKAIELIDSKYVQGDLRSFCNGRIKYGMLNGSIGYLRITTFYDYAATEGYVNALAVLQSALDVIFQDANKLTALVIDVRLNKGGDDSLGIEIASRLTRKKYLAYRKVARNDQGKTLHFTLPQDSWVVPGPRPAFYGDVVILTGPDTVSAGETFTMALMGRDPPVTRIGLNTQGVFSDVLNRLLPNGWSFRLPNEVYLSKQGKSFDSTGVPPHIRVPFLSQDDVRNGRDSALEEAIKFLSHSGRQSGVRRPVPMAQWSAID